MPARRAPSSSEVLVVLVGTTVPFYALGALYPEPILPGIPASALMVVSPAIAASWAAWRADGAAGVRALLARALDVTNATPRRWLFVSAVGMPLLVVAMYALTHRALPDVAWTSLPGLLALFLVAAACEEVAWTHTLLPPLARRHGVVPAALALGVVVAAWHVIPFSQLGRSWSWIAGQCAFTIGFRVVVTFAFGKTGQSLFAAIACHASFNTAWQLLPNPVTDYAPWTMAGLTCGVASALVLTSRSTTGGGGSFRDSKEA